MRSWQVVYELNHTPVEHPNTYCNFALARQQFDTADHSTADTVWLIREDGTAIDVKTLR